MSWIVTVLSLIGVVANVKKKSWCFAVWMITNAYWCVYDFARGLPSQAILFAVYFLISAWGLISWIREERSEK